MCFRRGLGAFEVLQIFQRRQVLDIQVYLIILRTWTFWRIDSYVLIVVGQWTAFVELLPLWLAPNMVTLLGFFFILANVILLEIFIPDLVGPVRRLPCP